MLSKYLPNAKQMDELNTTLAKLVEKEVIDDHNRFPGPITISRGDKTNGFYGFVYPSEMGKIEGATTGKEDFNGDNLCLALGLTAGTSINSEIPLLKFSRNGQVMFRPLRSYRHTVSWDQIYNTGLVYGVNGEGLLPPQGRLGAEISIDGTDNSINTTGNFLGLKNEATNYYDTVGAIGDVLVLKGWSNALNNKEVTIQSITEKKIVVNTPLVTETGGGSARFFKKANIVNQNKVITIGGKKYQVRLMRGAAKDPLNSYINPDRGTTGIDNEWNSLILPLHEKARLNNWKYPLYAKNPEGGNIPDWKVGLTERDLVTDYTYGTGSLIWCQETRNDTESYRRVFRGDYGSSHANADASWNSTSACGFCPVLVAL